MKRSIYLISAAIWLLAAGTTFGAIPKQINYQGTLSGSGGTPLADSTVDVEFLIFNAAAGGNSVWAETLSVTTDNLGRFSFNLGSIHPIEDTVFNQPERYLSINVESNGEMIPRTKLVSVGYSNRVNTVDGATGGIISGNTSIQSDLTVSGNVGIGTTSPLSNLHIESSNPIAEGARIVNTSSTGDANLSFLTDGIFQYTLGADNDDGDKFKISAGSNLSSSERLTITSTGNVGIGTTSPAAKLDVLNGRIRASSQVSSTGIEFFPATAGTPTNAGSIEGVGGSTNIAIMPVGNVGVGTTSPGAKLDVTGGYIRARDDGSNNTPTSGRGLELISTGSVGDVISYDRDLGIYLPLVLAASTLDLQIGGVGTALYLNSTGNVGIGTTSPTSKLEVVGDLEVSGNIIGSTSWTAFPFAAGYDNYVDAHGGGFQTVQYRKIGDIVYLRGAIHKADHAGIPSLAILGTLPVGFRPPAVVRFITHIVGSSVIDIDPSGSVELETGESFEYRFLDGICFSTSP